MKISGESIFVIILLSLFFGAIIYLSIKSRLEEKKEKEEQKKNREK